MNITEKQLKQLREEMAPSRKEPTSADRAKVIQALMLEKYCTLKDVKGPRTDIDDIMEVMSQWRETLGEKAFAKTFVSKKPTKNRFPSVEEQRYKAAAEKEAGIRKI